MADFQTMDKRTVIHTKDGTSTLYSSLFKSPYHSIHGARIESQHVYIDAGLKWWLERNNGSCTVFEIGFGTGLNAL